MIMAMDLDAFKNRIQSAIGIEPQFTSAYKACDFRPAFGEIFREELIAYDYWGSCDIDIILGNLRDFLEGLGDYDVFSTRREFLSGPLFFMRNSPSVNSLYKSSKDYEVVFSKNDHFCFDECNFAWEPLRAGRSILDVETEIESMSEVVVKAAGSGKIKAHFFTLSLEPRRSFKGRISIDHSRILKEGKEYIHYHHLHNKGRSVYTYPVWHWSDVPEHYQISKYGVFSRRGPHDLIYRFRQFVGRWSKRLKRWIERNVLKSTVDTNATKIT